MSGPYKLLLIGDSDSQLLACEALCRFPSDLNIQVTINAIPHQGTPELILQRAAGLGDLWRLNMGQLLTHPELCHFDAIGVYLTGSKISDFRLKLGLLPSSKRPLLFCGFNGVVLEKFMEGMSWRLGYDLICLSGPRDREALDRMLEGSPFAGQRTVLTGLHRQNVSDDPLLDQQQRRKQLVFAEQVVMPSSPSDRAEMVRILADLARRSPDWEVLIKPRIAPGERTFHDVKNHISTTLKLALGHPPDNLRIDYGSLPDLLAQARLMATISSTAFFDALDVGCRPLVMADFGINQNNGSHVFAGSGVWYCLDDVEDLDSLDRSLPSPDSNWLAWMGYGKNLEPQQLIEALRQLRTNPPEGKLTPPGYVSNVNSSFTQLRRDAEKAILEKNWQEAQSLLQLGSLMRPTHRNVARRLGAVQQRNRIIRRLLLNITYRDVG